ncbi:MAG: hydantoinase/oxoprolinase family protein [Betaproteobacteria bacterium]|nr:hydantoinase/oxoprolinase family protein [Betaproteobacteria bacterium]
MNENRPGLLLAADTGGTFTDIVAYDPGTGELSCCKTLTVYEDLVEGVLTGVDKLGADPRRLSLVKHGTTHIINTFLQRSGARTALVTTRGFRDSLEIARGSRPVPFRLDYRRQPPLVARPWRYEVAGRIDTHGVELEPLDPAELEALAATLRAEGVEAVAVSFLNAYVNPGHEEAVATRLRALLPDVFVTTGAEFSREWYEYERGATAVANAYVGPTMARYLGRFATRFAERGFTGRCYMMGSNGGVLTVEGAQAQPVALVESGPIGGCIGAAAMARELGVRNVIAFDMGGTTAKCSVIDNGQFQIEPFYWVGGYEAGFPIRSPVLDIVEVGTGGGSIAWIDAQTRLRVGPRSAGSEPGPVCYGRGGTEPTITDANLILGRIGSDSFLGGEMQLDADSARRALQDRVGTSLGYRTAAALDQLAQGILAIATMSMGEAIKRITLERGRDPRDFELYVYGGGGPLHGAVLARELHIPTVVVPLQPGNFSAIGMLLADSRIDDALTITGALEDESARKCDALFDGMEQAAARRLVAEFSARHVDFERQIELRFRGQRHSIRVTVTAGLTEQGVRGLFEAAYRERFGHLGASGKIEFVGLRLRAWARTASISVKQLFSRTAASGKMAVGNRPVYFPELGARVATPVYWRDALPVGFRATGPAVIEEYGSTTVVGPKDEFSIGSLNEIRITCG